MRIAFCAIVFDRDPEHKELGAMLASAQKAGFTDWVLAVDQKAIEGTEDFLLNTLGPDADIFPFKMELEDGVEDFARARNLTLARVPKECEWWGWADRDDTIEMLTGKTIPEILSDIPEKDTSGRPIAALFFDYDYAQDEYGNSTTTHLKGRLYRTAFRWEWRNRVHEDCYPLDGDFGISLAVVPNEEDLMWVHHIGDRPSAYERNMRILRKMLEDDPKEPRTWYYLGNQHFAQHEWSEAAEAFERYVGISGWDQEKWAALIYQGIAYQQLEMWEKAIASYTRAMLLKPELADSYFGIGEVHVRMGQWEKGRYWGEAGIERVARGGLPDKTVFFNANAYQFNPYLWLATCYWNLGEHDLALSAYEQAYKARPDEDTARTIEHLKWAIARERITRNGLDLAAGLIRRNEPLKARGVLENLPAGASERSDVRQALAVVAKETAHLYDPTRYRNFYFRSELGNVEDPTVWFDKPSGGIPRLDWTVRTLREAGAKKILQVGVGNGHEGAYLAKAGFAIVGIDINPLAVKEANWTAVKAGLLGTRQHRVATDEEAEEEGIEAVIETPDITPESPYQAHHSDVREVRRDILDLGPFDAVLATELIEHVPDVDELLGALDALGPRVIISTPDGSWDGPQPRNPDHVRAYSLKELATALQSHGALVDLHSVPGGAEGVPDNLVAQYLPKTLFRGEQVVIYCGNTGQGWTPDSIHSGGIGGSETAVIRVAEELAGRGFRVKVWAECEGIWNNVSYSYAEDFIPWECDLFVSWRQVGPIQKVSAREKWIWCHDVHFGVASEELLREVKVIAMSRWHRDFLQRLYPPARIMVAGNGIDPERFDKEAQREKHRLIYASSPDRGLNVVLRSWPKIKEKFPDATLDVFYGFEMARRNNPEFIASIEEMARQDGVTLHGRVDQNRLADEYLRSDVLLYPAQMPDGEPFTETYCISVVEAQTAGCVPITPSWGALSETNSEGIQTNDLLSALEGFWGLSDKKQEARRRKCREWARKQTWSSVADLWVAYLQPKELAA